jgi:hypothetical protein
MSAFTSGADPRVLSEGVIVGPTLKQHLGGDMDAGKVYQALIRAASGKHIQLRALSPSEAVRFASVAEVRAGDPLFALQANGLVLVLQYAPGHKNISFVEQLGGPIPRAAAAPKPEAPKEAPPPPPSAPPAAAPARGAPPVARPAEKPPPVLRLPPPPGLSAPAEAPASATAPAPATAATPRPRGECVIKPVMSDDDLYNCGATPRPPVAPR